MTGAAATATTGTSVLDAPHREAVVNDLDRNFFVEAGAGTGKTKTLVDRIVNLVAAGRLVEIHQLAAITFTEAAAAELRDRIRTELERAAAPTSGRDEPSRGRCLAAARRIDEAVITTLHGFAQRILAEHPVAAGLPPAFEVDEGIPAELEFLERWAVFVDELLADPSLEGDLRVAVTLRLSLPRLGEVARLLHDRWDRLEGLQLPAASPIVVDVDPVVGALRTAVAHWEPHAEHDDRLVELVATRVLPVLEVYEAAAATGDVLEQLRVLDAVTMPKPGNLGTAKVWGDQKAVVVGELRAAAEAREQLLCDLRSRALARLLPRLLRFTLDWAAERRRTGRLHFHDLLVLARDLLWSNTAVRTTLAERWSVLLVDEFQDTDPLQVELVFALAAADPMALPARWDDIELGPGRVLVVGDPKQSIYGFRGADITLWNRTAARFGDDVVHLWQNFRSVGSILHWVNEVFQRLIGEGDGEAQPPYVPLASSRTSLDRRPEVVLLGGPAAEGVRASEVRSLEAEEIAAAVATLRAAGQPVIDRDGDGRSRPMRYDDVAILVPTRAPIGPIERALDDADIPYRIESRSLVWRTDVVRELLAILTAVEDPSDEVAVVAALRSPAFACTDRELVAWRQAGGRWDPGRRLPEEVAEDHPVRVAMSTLRRWHDQRHWSTVDALVDTVVAEARLVELTMAQRRPRDHWRRIRFVVDQARAFVEAGGATLAQFLAWTSLQTDEDAAAIETVVPEPDDDAVRILTVHGAKGLEFPVVIVAGLATARPIGLTGVVWKDAGPELMLVAEGGGGTFTTSGWDEARAGADRLERAEAVRLLYVAATRARDQLIVSLHHPARYANETHAKVLYDLCAGMADTWRPAVSDTPQLLLPPPPAGPPARSTVERAAWIERQEALLAAAQRRWSVSPTGLAALAGSLDEVVGDLDDDAAPAGPPPAIEHGDTTVLDAGAAHRGGTAVGRAVHAVLEGVPLDGTAAIPDEVVANLAARSAAAEAVDADQVAALAASALRSAALAEAREAGRLWREVPVAVPGGDRLLEGFIDLLYERPDGSLVVVDWKTDRARGEAEIDAALDRYRLQGAGYAVALIAATGRPVAEVRFVFCRGGGQPAVERTVADLEGAASEVSALLR